MTTVDSTTKSLLTGILMVLLLYIIAVPFYMYMEGLTLLDATYFVTVSITSAGYGDITPKTDAGKIFAVVLLLSGVSIFFYHITHLGMFRERAIDPHVQRRIEMLRNLTALHSGEVKKEETQKIREKIKEGRSQGFGRL